MTRIVAGSARGRRLRVPAGTGTRPTSDRVREALFSSLESIFGGFDRLRVLDLYAGSGALGLEALSRGAAHVVLVESDAQAVRTIRSNVESVGLPGATVVRDRVERFLSAPVVPGDTQSAGDGGPGFDLVLADPPYGLDTTELAATLRQLESGWLAPDGLIVVERDRRSGPIHWPDGLTGLRERAYGQTVLWYGRPAGH